jgi:hypothetical protein
VGITSESFAEWREKDPELAQRVENLAVGPGCRRSAWREPLQREERTDRSRLDLEVAASQSSTVAGDSVLTLCEVYKTIRP